MENTTPVKKPLQTEDLGKIFEMAICRLYDIPFVGKYKYSIEAAEQLKTRICAFKNAFNHELVHTAEKGARYDFTCSSNTDLHLSVKTNKKGDKVCPQVIGQPTKKKFCEFFHLDLNSTNTDIKNYIEQHVKEMLPMYWAYTFDCDILYYRQDKNQLLYVHKKEEPDWTIMWNWFEPKFSHKENGKEWNESTTLMVNDKAIGEFQVHNHRSCIKFRWNFKTALELFNVELETFEL